MSGIVATIPTVVLADTGSTSSVTYTDNGVNFDYSIQGIPFLSAASAQNPMVRKTAPYRKPPNDNSQEPGEQSLAYWWIKAQSSFHGGAGQIYIDTPVPQGAEIRPVRYQTSAGVDPWTQGKISQLRTTSKAATVVSATACNLRCVQTAAGANIILYTDGTAMFAVTETLSTDGNGNSVPAYGAPVTVNVGAGSNIQTLTTDGRYYYCSDGAFVYKGDITTPATLATKIYNLTSGTPVLAWVKQRLMLGYTTASTAKVFELDNNASAGSALPTAKFTHPNTTWLWTCFADGPGAIYAAGYAGQSSAVYKFVLDSGGATPTLTTGITLSEMPPGEIIYGMQGYLGTVIGLITSRGFRVGQYVQGAGSGDFQHGPISVPFTGSPTSAAVVGSDRFLYCGYVDSAGVAGLARVDFSQQLSIRPFSYVPDQRFAWAPDLRATDNSEALVAGQATQVDLLAGRKVMLVPGQGVFVEHPSFLTPSASLTTSRIRYETLDPKLPRFVRIRAEGTAGTLAVAVNGNSDSGGANVYTLDPVLTSDSTDLAISLAPVQYATVTFTWARSNTNKAQGPTLLGYQLKALPAQKRQRFIRLPLSCYDHEEDDAGQRTGGDGYAESRLLAMEALDVAGDIVSFQVLSPFADNSYTTLAVIEDLEFTQTENPNAWQGWGGVLNVTLRTIG